MNGDRWQRINSLFLETAPLARDQRAAAIERSCGEDRGAPLRSRIAPEGR